MAEAVARQARQVDAAERGLRLGISVFTAGALVLTALALIMRLAALDRESLWLDEGYTLLFSGLPLPRLLTIGGAHEHPPLFYLLVHAVDGVWPSYLVPRAISALAGGFSVLAIYALGKRLISEPAGLVAATLVAVSPFHLWYSHDGRAYELAGLFVLLSYLCLMTAWREGSRMQWSLYAVCTVLALYTEYTTVFVLVPQVLFLRRGNRALLLSWGAVALCYVPWLGILLHDTAAVAGDYWIPSPTMSSVSATVLEFMGLLTPCPSPPCTGQELPIVAGTGTLLVWMAVAGVLAAALWTIRSRSMTVGVLVAWLLAPFIIVLALSSVRSLYLDRIFLDATFPLYLLVGSAIAWAWTSARARPALAAAFLLFLGANVATLTLVYGGRSNPDWPSLARDLRSAYRPGQAVMFNPGVLRSLASAYLPAGWHATRERALWSRSYIDVPGWQQYYSEAVKSDPVTRSRIEAILRNRQLAEVTRGARATWLVTFDYPGLNDSRRWFTSHGFQALVSQLYSGDTRLELWSRQPPSSLGTPVVRGFGPSWQRAGRVEARPGTVTEIGDATISRSFPVRAGRAYSAAIQYQAMPGSSPHAQVNVFDANGKLLTTFPRTMWYELPAVGVWLSQPFGFIPPPGAAHATLTLGTTSNLVRWRQVGVFTAR